MDGDFVRREEQKQLVQRLDEENHRQNRRIEELETKVGDLHGLTLSVGKMADHMANIDKEQEKQGKRLETLEGRDGEMWRKVTGYVVTAIISVLIGVISSHIGM